MSDDTTNPNTPPAPDWMPRIPALPLDEHRREEALAAQRVNDQFAAIVAALARRVGTVPRHELEALEAWALSTGDGLWGSAGFPGDSTQYSLYPDADPAAPPPPGGVALMAEAAHAEIRAARQRNAAFHTWGCAPEYRYHALGNGDFALHDPSPDAASWDELEPAAWLDRARAVVAALPIDSDRSADALRAVDATLGYCSSDAILRGESRPADSDYHLAILQDRDTGRMHLALSPDPPRGRPAPAPKTLGFTTVWDFAGWAHRFADLEWMRGYGAAVVLNGTLPGFPLPRREPLEADLADRVRAAFAPGAE